MHSNGFLANLKMNQKVGVVAGLFLVALGASLYLSWQTLMNQESRAMQEIYLLEQVMESENRAVSVQNLQEIAAPRVSDKGQQIWGLESNPQVLALLSEYKDKLGKASDSEKASLTKEFKARLFVLHQAELLDSKKFNIGLSILLSLLGLFIGYQIVNPSLATLKIIGNTLRDIRNGVLKQKKLQLGNDEVAQLYKYAYELTNELQDCFDQEKVSWEDLREDSVLSQRLTSMVNSSPINIMFASPDSIIQYMNPASSKTLRQIEQHLPRRVDDIVGDTFDVFHKNPQRISKIVASGTELPLRSNIALGPETIDLLISPIFNKTGEYLGAMATWTLITEQLKLEERENEAAEKMRSILSSADTISQQIAGSAEELRDISSALVEASSKTQEHSQVGASATTQLASNINTMAAASEEIGVNINSVASSAEEVSVNMQSVSEIAKEMNSSISSVENSAKEAMEVSNKASNLSSSATSTMNNLGNAAREIGKVTDVIKRIAEQTNLLALNATIEAASAGEAGKGFAVVANEIKELANQSAQAAEDIASRIEGVQQNSKEAVDVIDQVSEIIDKINMSVAEITFSVESQTSATADMSNKISEAATGANNIAETIAEVATGATDVSRNVGEAAQVADNTAASIEDVSRLADEGSAQAMKVQSSAEELASIAMKLQEIVRS